MTQIHRCGHGWRESAAEAQQFRCVIHGRGLVRGWAVGQMLQEWQQQQALAAERSDHGRQEWMAQAPQLALEQPDNVSHGSLQTCGWCSA